jgi:hypothetical protein
MLDEQAGSLPSSVVTKPIVAVAVRAGRDVRSEMTWTVSASKHDPVWSSLHERHAARSRFKLWRTEVVVFEVSRRRAAR